MSIDDRVIQRLNELTEQSTKIRIERSDYIQSVNQVHRLIIAYML
jgi:hypothetical protein